MVFLGTSLTAGFRETLQGRLFAREFREYLIEVGNLQNFFYFWRQSNDFHLPVSFYDGNVHSGELANSRAVQIL